MATSSVSGSVLDVASIVTQLMQAERQPVVALQQRVADDELAISALGQLSGKFSQLQSALDALFDASAYGGYTSTSSAPAVLGATAASNAVAGDYEVKVVSTAQAQAVAAGGFADTGSALSAVPVTLTLESGSYAADGSFTAAANNTLSLPSGITLAGVRDAINGAGGPYRANLVQTGTAWSLVLVSAQTGTASSLRVSVAGAPAGSALLGLAFSKQAGDVSNATETRPARDAVVLIDGLRVTRSSNTIDDAIPGVSLQLKQPTNVAEDQAVATNLKVAATPVDLGGRLNAVASAYNAALSQYRQLTAASADAARRGPFNMDGTLRMVMERTRQLLTQGGTDAAGNAFTLAGLGLELARDGTGSVSQKRLTQALAAGAVTTFAAGVSHPLSAYLLDTVTTGGTIDRRRAR